MAKAVVKASSGTGLTFDHFLPCRFKAINEQALKSLYGTRECLGISHPEFYILVVLSEHILSEHSDVSSRDISNTTGMDKATITRALDRLVEKGLISRSKSKADSRLVRLKLRAKGKRIYEQIEKNTLEWERQYLRNISVKELNSLHAILDKLSANLDLMEGQ